MKFSKHIPIFVLLVFFSINLSYAQKGRYKNLEDALKEPLSVKELFLNEGISKLPDGVLEMKNLERINLAHNKQLDVKDVIEKLSKLKKVNELDVSFCEITSLPKEIGSLKSLRILKLAANKLTDIPSAIGELRNLRELIFSQYPDDDFRSFTIEQKKRIITLLPDCKIFLVDYFGSVHGHYRLGKEKVRVTLDNVDSL